MKISEAAAISGCHRETIRYYERLGLITEPLRNGHGYRNYSLQQVSRLRFIRRGRALGFSLDEIRSLLQLNDEPQLACDEADRLARLHLAQIKVRIDELVQMTTQLEAMINGCTRIGSEDCTILEALRDCS